MHLGGLQFVGPRSIFILRFDNLGWKRIVSAFRKEGGSGRDEWVQISLQELTPTHLRGMRTDLSPLGLMDKKLWEKPFRTVEELRANDAYRAGVLNPAAKRLAQDVPADCRGQLGLH